MAPADRLQIARDCYRAYETGERRLVEQHLHDDFTFFSPADFGLDREQYFERCWANSGLIDAFAFRRLAEVGDEVFVTYEATRTDGSRFRNTEVLTIEGDKLIRTEVYFGWNLPETAS